MESINSVLIFLPTFIEYGLGVTLQYWPLNAC